MKIKDLPNLPWDEIDKRDSPLWISRTMDVDELLETLAITPIDPQYQWRDRGYSGNIPTSVISTMKHGKGFFNKYGRNNNLNFHQDFGGRGAVTQDHTCVIGVEGFGHLWTRDGNLDGNFGSDGQILKRHTGVRRYPMEPGDLLCWSRQVEKRGKFLHGGPTGARTSLVVRF